MINFSLIVEKLDNDAGKSSTQGEKQSKSRICG